jgi:putative ATPase
MYIKNHAGQPLAARVRPRRLDEYVGQGHLLAEGKPLRESIQTGRPHSMILWGPPGVGKTTFAQLLAQHFDIQFLAMSAVMGGVKEIRSAVEQAQLARTQHGQQTLLFVDEVHRFNKAQQDAFLPYIENGTFVFVGATTENPSFELNNALLSRTRVYCLNRLSDSEIEQVLQQALEHKDGFPGKDILLNTKQSSLIARYADGDARRSLNTLELAIDLTQPDGDCYVITEQSLEAVFQQSLKRFDKSGDIFYDQISALHKSIRGSDPDAALYWMQRMLIAGCDPFYVVRRVVRIASEDIGNADPRALQLSLNAWEALERLGQAEGELSLAQAVIYLASAPKSNAVYNAYKASYVDAKEGLDEEVPMHLRNAPTPLMKNSGAGKSYRYVHDEPDAFAAGESYLPKSMHRTRYYYPVSRGLELKIEDKLSRLRVLNEASSKQRYEN